MTLLLVVIGTVSIGKTAQEGASLDKATIPLAQEEAVMTFFWNFLDVWLVEQDIDRALTFMEQPNRVLASLVEPFGVKESEVEMNFDVWIRKILVMWLFRDHGQVNSLGHGDPNEKGFGCLPITPQKVSGRLQPRTIDEIVSTAGVVGKLRGDENYWVMLRLRHASHDTLFFALKKVGGHWKVIDLTWVIDH